MSYRELPYHEALLHLIETNTFSDLTYFYQYVNSSVESLVHHLNYDPLNIAMMAALRLKQCNHRIVFKLLDLSLLRYKQNMSIPERLRYDETGYLELSDTIYWLTERATGTPVYTIYTPQLIQHYISLGYKIGLKPFTYECTIHVYQ